MVKTAQKRYCNLLCLFDWTVKLYFKLTCPSLVDADLPVVAVLVVALDQPEVDHIYSHRCRLKFRDRINLFLVTLVIRSDQEPILE